MIWLTIAGLGVFHGVNPAMGWLFAVALGLHRGSRATVLLSLVPIALGHALAVAIVLAAALALGRTMDPRLLTLVAAAILLGWAAWHAAFGHRQRVRVGMRTGLAGLALWSFLMAAAHGAGLMLVPVLLPICTAGSEALDAGAVAGIGIAAVAVHSAALLTTTAAVAVVVYEWLGLAALRTAWINFDRIWVTALALSGGALLVSA
jgi:hypothetical protein